MNGFDQFFDDLGNESVICETHGEYTQSTMRVKKTGKIIVTQCQKCNAIRKEQQETQKQKEYYDKLRADSNQAKVKKLLTASFIPNKFRSMSFDNFVITDGNRKALIKFKAFVDSLSVRLSNGNGFIVKGDIGTGKTHLCCALATQAINAGHSAVFTTIEEIALEIREARNFSNNSSEKVVLAKYSNIDLLIIDDIKASLTDEESKLMSVILDSRYKLIKSTFITTNLALDVNNKSDPLSLYKALGERSIDRLREYNDVVILAGQSMRGKSV